MVIRRIFTNRSRGEKAARPAARSARRQARPGLERLEDRLVPAVVVEYPHLGKLKRWNANLFGIPRPLFDRQEPQWRPVLGTPGPR
jgi:hypothetical protein